MSLIIAIAIIIVSSFALIIWLDNTLNQNDDATTIGQFKKFQDSFKGEK